MSDSTQAQSQDQPQVQDLLSQLIMNLPRDGAPAFNGNGPMRPDAAQPVSPAQPSIAAQPAKPAQPVQPSDDPAITNARQGLTDSLSQMQGSLGRMQGIQQKIAAVPTVNPADYKPTWKDRLLGFAQGTATGFDNPDKAAQRTHDVEYRRLDRANASRNATLAPLMQQLGTEREALPLYKDSAEVAKDIYGTARNERTDQRLQEATDARAQYEKEIAGIRSDVAANNLDVAQQRIAEMGKRLDEKTTNDRDKLDLQSKLLDLKQQIADRNQDKPATKQQSLAVQNGRDQAWMKARREYETAASKLDPSDKQGLTDLQNEYYEKAQDAQDEYEQKIGVLGGTAQHVELPRNHFGEAPTSAAGPVAPVAQPAQASAQPATPPVSLWKGREGKVLILKGSKGETSKWQLVKGQPQQVQQGAK